MCSPQISVAHESFRELSDGTPGNRATHTMFDSHVGEPSHNISRNPTKFRGREFSRPSFSCAPAQTAFPAYVRRINEESARRNRSFGHHLSTGNPSFVVYNYAEINQSGCSRRGKIIAALSCASIDVPPPIQFPFPVTA